MCVNVVKIKIKTFLRKRCFLELGQQDPDDPNRMWGPDIISPIFPFKGYERPTEEVRKELQEHLVGQEIRMYGPQNESEARAIKQPMDGGKMLDTVSFNQKALWEESQSFYV